MFDNSKDSIITAHKFFSKLDEGAASAALVQTLGNGLSDGSLSKDDVAEIILSAFDAEMADTIKKQPSMTDDELAEMTASMLMAKLFDL